MWREVLLTVTRSTFFPKGNENHNLTPVPLSSLNSLVSLAFIVVFFIFITTAAKYINSQITGSGHLQQTDSHEKTLFLAQSIISYLRNKCNVSIFGQKQQCHCKRPHHCDRLSKQKV